VRPERRSAVRVAAWVSAVGAGAGESGLVPRRRNPHESSTDMPPADSTPGRAVPAAAAGGAAVAASAPARAQQTRAKGPLVWLDMDQQALDDAYDQIVYAPNREQVAKRRIANSERARAAIGAPERVAYGATEIEKLDIYR